MLTATANATDAVLAIVPQNIGKYGLDMISLFPQKTFKGRKNGLRADLAQAIADIHPRFVRFPGGCLAHGDGIDNIYDWKGSIGALEARKPMPNIWRYHQTRGLGYYEFFQFCEDINAEPLPVIAAGIPCQNSGQCSHHSKDEITCAGQQGGIPMEEMGPLRVGVGKKSTYIFTMAALAVLSILFFYLPCTPFGFWLMLIMQIIISICTGIVSPLIWSMYADVSDYAELKDGTASTGLIFSSSSMAQKFGGAFGGAAVMWILASFGYNTAEGAVQTAEALTGLNLLMSWIPAAVAVVAMIVVYFYPLTKKRVEEINKGLKKVRASD